MKINMIVNEYLLNDSFGNMPLLKMFHSVVQCGKRNWREHHHTEFELSVFISGSGIYSLKNCYLDFKKGDIFLFSSNEVHCITEISPGESLDLLNIQFEPRFLWSDTSVLNSGLLKIFFNRSENFENRIDRKNPATKKIRDIIFKMENEFKNQKPEYESMIKIYLTEILIYLIREYDYIKPDSENYRCAEVLKQLENAMVYINDNLEKEITLTELSASANMSRTYFSTVFKKFNGISPWEYINIKRIEKALTLLKSTDKTKLEIASDCGFSSLSNFYKAFRRVTGKSPGDLIRGFAPSFNASGRKPIS